MLAGMRALKPWSTAAKGTATETASSNSGHNADPVTASQVVRVHLNKVAWWLDLQASQSMSQMHSANADCAFLNSQAVSAHASTGVVAGEDLGAGPDVDASSLSAPTPVPAIDAHKALAIMTKAASSHNGHAAAAAGSKVCTTGRHTSLLNRLLACLHIMMPDQVSPYTTMSACTAAGDELCRHNAARVLLPVPNTVCAV